MLKIFKSSFNIIFDKDKDIDIRTYNLVMWSGIASSFLGTIICILANTSIWGAVHTLFVFFGAILCMWIGNRFGKYELGRFLLGIGIIFLIPAIWMTGGGLHSGVNLWLVYGMVYLTILFQGRKLTPYIVLYIAVIVSVFAISYYHPNYILKFYRMRDVYTSVMLSAFAVGVILMLTIRYQFFIYSQVREIAKQRHEQLEEINEMQKSFFASISHEIRTPINTIIGLNEMNLRMDSSEEVQENCINIQGASKMLLSLINDILDLSKIQSGKMDIVCEQYEVTNLLSELVNMSWVRAHDKGLEFHLDVAESIPSMLYGDSVRLKQILINMLTNAIKYTEKGSVTLRMRGERKENNLILLQVSVQDTGIGIKKEDLGSLFDAFKRVDQERNSNIEGTGLGLAISGELAELMGGKIKVDSIYHQGTTFTLSIEQKIIDDKPIGPVSNRMKTKGKKSEYIPRFQAKDARVLVVDDNEMNLLVAKKLLRETKVQVDVAKSGLQCLEMTSKKHYHAIFMDHLMPDMDGIETLKMLRKQTVGPCINTPVVAMTANAGSDMESFYLREGFQGYLVKPINTMLFEAMLEKCLPRELVIMNQTFEDDNFEETEVRISKNYKKKLTISADSVCDLPKDILEKYQIPILPYYVTSDEGRFQEGTEIWPENIQEFLEKNRKMKSSAPEIEEYENFFGHELGEAEQIIHICMTSKTSEGYGRAKEAAESFDHVYVVDSEHLSTGMGLMVLEAAKMAAANEDVSTILATLENVKKRIVTSFMLKETNQLYFNGRISSVVNRISRLFSLYPVIYLRNGYMKVGAVKYGRLRDAYKSYIRTILKNKDIDKEYVFMTGAMIRCDERENFKNEVQKYHDFEHVVDAETSSAITSNCGIGTIGIIYILKE